ncbi:MAG: sulfite exporter TauE/SafE family protein, partial [Planctomycetota bacterium]|nr:sulfite exporter TauE/SafE family protein [Planctomycetota bacterium]
MMDWAETLLNGFLLGIASLPLCTTCYLLFVPVLVVSSSGTVFSHLKFFSLFAVGRLTGYIAVGAAAGFLAPTVPFVAQKEFFGLVQLVLAVALLVWAIRHLRRELATCKEPSKNPFLFGLLSGLSLCPPFLAGVLLALYYGAVLKGIALFLGFFAGAVIPLFCLTLCGLATKLNSVRRIGLVFAIFAAFSLA